MLTAVLLAAIAAPSQTAHDRGVFRIDAAQSEIVARVFKEGIASSFAHDHVIRASKIDGEVRFDAKNPEAGSISIRIASASLIADEPAVRTKHHVEKEIGESDRAKIEETMLGPEQLDAKRFTEIAFQSTRIQESGDGRYTISGVLTLHGREQPVAVDVHAKLDGGTLHATGTFPIRQSSFGIMPYSVALGSIRTKDEVRIELSIVATASLRNPS